MIKFSAEFENERGEDVSVDVIYHEGTVKVVISREYSGNDEMNMTQVEMAAIRKLLNPTYLEPAYRHKSE
jgi:hypothetical protein